MGTAQAGKNERAKNCFQNRALSHRWALYSLGIGLVLHKTGYPACTDRTRLMRRVYKKPQSRPEEEQAQIEEGGSYS